MWQQSPDHPNDMTAVYVPVTVTRIGAPSPATGVTPIVLTEDLTGETHYVAAWVWTDRIHHGLHTFHVAGHSTGHAEAPVTGAES
jgi:hypothetical protein